MVSCLLRVIPMGLAVVKKYGRSGDNGKHDFFHHRLPLSMETASMRLTDLTCRSAIRSSAGIRMNLPFLVIDSPSSLRARIVRSP